MGKEQSEVPVHLPESGSDSRAPQTLPGVTEEPVLGSLGHMETKDVRFSVLDTSDTAGCQGRAENGAGGWGRRVLGLLWRLGLGWLAGVVTGAQRGLWAEG